MSAWPELLRAQALALGFDACALTPATLPETHGLDLQAFLAASHHGDMRWMEERSHWRAAPQAMWEQAKTAIVLGHNYAPQENPLKRLEEKTNGNISVYAQNKDYHDVIKKRLKQLARGLAQETGGQVKVFVDTAPLMEKPLAAQAGLGWQGKHTCLVSREFGSWLFLGVILTDLEIPLHPALSVKKDSCGSCRACMDICPTQAIIAERQLDARRCISYLTIEHAGPIPHAFRKAMGNRIYGCDDCLAICPWNKFAQTAREISYHPRPELKNPPLDELAMLDDAAFRALFSKSPIKRIGRNRFIRNVLIAMGNSEEATLLPIAQRLKNDADAVVREAAKWAVGELGKEWIRR